MAASPATICLTANTDAPPLSAALRAGEESGDVISFLPSATRGGGGIARTSRAMTEGADAEDLIESDHEISAVLIVLSLQGSS